MRFSLPRRGVVLVAQLLLLAGLVSCAAPPAAQGADTAKRLHTLFDEAWEGETRRNPPFATYVGDTRYGDRLEDASPEADAERYAAVRRYLTLAQSIPHAGLSSLDASSLDVFIHNQQDELEHEPLIGFRRMTLGAIGGFQNDFAELLSVSPVSTKAEVEQLLARLAAYPRRVDQELVRLATAAWANDDGSNSRDGQWVQWIYSIPAPVNPFTDITG